MKNKISQLNFNFLPPFFLFSISLITHDYCIHSFIRNWIIGNNKYIMAQFVSKHIKADLG